MSGKGMFGSSFSINHEVNLIGEKTEIRCTGKKCQEVLAEENSESIQEAPYIPAALGAIPVHSEPSALSTEVMSAIGAVCAAGTIQVTQDQESGQYHANYILSLMKVLDGAYAKNGNLSEKELKERMKLLMTRMLEDAGPAFASYKEILMDAMQKETVQSFMKGIQETICALVKDPVNANTGNFIYEKEDLVINGKIPLRFQRFYNAIDDRAGCLGKGWRHNYEIQLLIEADRYVILWEDGREEFYLRDGDNQPEPLFGGCGHFMRSGENYLYETRDKISYLFHAKGNLLKQESANGQGMYFTYDKQGRLSRVTNGYGSSLNYKYDPYSGMLLQVTDHTGRRIAFVYECGRLKEVKNGAGYSYFYYYDADRNIYRICNPRGVHVLENNYDSQRRITKQVFADGGEITFDYQDDLSRTLVTEQNGNKVVYIHDGKFRNIKTVYIDGEETFRYNDRNQLVARTDKMGNKTRFSYDDKGNTTQIIYPDGSKHNMTYNADNRLLTMSVNGMEKIKNTYDAKGNLIKTADALHRCRQIAYDENGNAVKVTQPDGSELSLTYDSRGNVIHLTDGAGSCTSYEYDDCNRVIRKIDGNGNSTHFAYNDSNQITCVTNGAGAYRTYEYTKNGKVTKIRDFNGAITTQEYNDMNQVKSITLPDGGTTYMEYDQMHNVSRKVLPNGAEIKYAYDSLNHLEQVTLPTGGKISYEYDPNGNRTAVIDPNGNRTTTEYDERNRITKTMDPAGASTEYEYDMEGHLVSITNAAGKSHTYVYDEAGQVIGETDISGNTTQYEYNELGNLVCKTDPQKRKTVYEYAPGGSLSRITYPDDTYERFFYDKNRNLIRRQNQKGDFLEFTYDCLDRMTAVKSSFGQEKHYTYDAAGNGTEYAYDAMGDLITICQHQGTDIWLKEDGQIFKSGIPDGNLAHITQYKRNWAGEIETITDPLGLQEQYGYDLAGQMVSKKDKEGYITYYTYNSVGEIGKQDQKKDSSGGSQLL